MTEFNIQEKTRSVLDLIALKLEINNINDEFGFRRSDIDYCGIDGHCFYLILLRLKRQGLLTFVRNLLFEDEDNIDYDSDEPPSVTVTEFSYIYSIKVSNNFFDKYKTLDYSIETNKKEKKPTIYISDRDGIYIEKSKKQPVKLLKTSKKMKLLKALQNNSKMMNELTVLLSQSPIAISGAKKKINDDCIKILGIKCELITHLKGGGYDLNKTIYKFKFD